MRKNEMERINKICFDRLEKDMGSIIKENLSFQSSKDFTEYYSSNEMFSQISYKPVLTSDKELCNKTLLSLSVEEGETFARFTDTLNNRLQIIQNEVVEEEVFNNRLFQSDKSTYFAFNKVGWNIGICNFMLNYRHNTEDN